MRTPAQLVGGYCRGSGVSSPFADVAGALACVVPTDVDIYVSVSRVAIIGCAVTYVATIERCNN